MNYMSSDRSDVQYAEKEQCREIANPSRGSWKSLQKLCRKMKGFQTVTCTMQAWESVDVVSVDSDWANVPKENRQAEV